MRDYLRPRQCAVCGKTFIPGRHNQMSCGDPVCVRKYKNRNNNQYRKIHCRKKDGYRQNTREKREPKPDTIVAIGYADRQREETLKMAGKVRTEL